MFELGFIILSRIAKVNYHLEILIKFTLLKYVGSIIMKISIKFIIYILKFKISFEIFFFLDIVFYNNIVLFKNQYEKSIC